MGFTIDDLCETGDRSTMGVSPAACTNMIEMYEAMLEYIPAKALLEKDKLGQGIKIVARDGGGNDFKIGLLEFVQHYYDKVHSNSSPKVCKVEVEERVGSRSVVTTYYLEEPTPINEVNKALNEVS